MEYKHAVSVILMPLLLRLEHKNWAMQLGISFEFHIDHEVGGVAASYLSGVFSDSMPSRIFFHPN